MDKNLLKSANKRVRELIAKYGKTDNSELIIDFFFYSNNENDASNLAIELKNSGYEVGINKNNYEDSKRWSVTGQTEKMLMETKSIDNWSAKMYDLAIKHNSEFDGWGTLIDQDSLDDVHIKDEL